MYATRKGLKTIGCDHGQTKRGGQMMYIPGPDVYAILAPFIVFVLSVLYHLGKKDYEGRSELYDKSMMTCLKSIIVLWVILIILSVGYWILPG